MDLVSCRSEEIELLKAFITNDPITLAPAVIVHGPRSGGKTFSIDHYLRLMNINSSLVKCDECVTKRVLLQKCLKTIRDDTKIDKEKYSENVSYRGGEVTNFGGLCENFENLIIALEQFKQETGYDKKHVLVLDRIDQCMENVDDLLPAFARLHEQSTLDNYSVIFVTSSRDIDLGWSIPHIYFNAYSQEQLIEIVCSKKLCSLEGIDTKTLQIFYEQFVKTIIDIYYTLTGLNLLMIIEICQQLWPSFTEPVYLGKYGVNDFLKIFREKRKTIDRMVVGQSMLDGQNNGDLNRHKNDEESSSLSFDLPIHSQYILLACYLASLIEPKFDLQLFLRLKTLRANAKKVKKMDQIDSRLLTPGTFELERMLAILTAIYRGELKSDLIDTESEMWNHELATFTLSSNIDVNVQLATLALLGLVSRTSSDVLSSQARWKCNITWSIADAVAVSLNFPLKNYLEGS